jgi:hypothetical protein
MQKIKLDSTSRKKHCFHPWGARIAVTASIPDLARLMFHQAGGPRRPGPAAGSATTTTAADTLSLQYRNKYRMQLLPLMFVTACRFVAGAASSLPLLR